MIEIDMDDEATRGLWRAVGELVASLPDDWVLIGGLMVQLHAIEHGVTGLRVTSDIDLLGQARPPGALSRIDRALQAQDFGMEMSDPEGFGWRYTRGELIVDVLAPDGFKKAPPTLGTVKALPVPGGQQALRRAEKVQVMVDGASFTLRRPTLLGAILIKARSLMRHSDPDAQREDLVRLLALVDDPRAMAAELSKAERRWLEAAEKRLAFDAAAGPDIAVLRRASQTFRLLLRAG